MRALQLSLSYPIYADTGSQVCFSHVESGRTNQIGNFIDEESWLLVEVTWVKYQWGHFCFTNNWCPMFSTKTHLRGVKQGMRHIWRYRLECAIGLRRQAFSLNIKMIDQRKRHNDNKWQFSYPKSSGEYSRKPVVLLYFSSLSLFANNHKKREGEGWWRLINAHTSASVCVSTFGRFSQSLESSCYLMKLLTILPDCLYLWLVSSSNCSTTYRHTPSSAKLTRFNAPCLNLPLTAYDIKNVWSYCQCV